MATKRNYAKEYANYQGTPEQIRKRAQRNAARALYEKKNGDLPASVDVDHRQPISKGGGNKAANLRALPQGKNRKFKRKGPGGKPA